MSEPSDEQQAQPQPGQALIDRRAWSRERQIRVAGIATAAAVIGSRCASGLAAGCFGGHEAPPAEAPPPAGTFRATPQQLKTLTIETVGAARRSSARK